MRSSIMRFSWLVLLAACGTDGADDEEMVDCSKVTGVDTFVVGLEKMGAQGKLDFKLMSIDPAPPVRGDNTWVVQLGSLGSGDAQPISGATLKVTPFMPAHQHPSGVTCEVTPMTEAGQYKLSPVNMWMQGVWEVTIQATVTSTTTVSDSAIYKFCIP